MGWRVSSVTTEALANLRASPVRSGLLWLTIVGLSAGVAALELGSAGSAVRFQRELVERGLYVHVVTAHNGVSAVQCAAISRADGVRHAGGIRRESVVTLSSAPDTRVQSARATAEFFSVLDPKESTQVRQPALGLVAGGSLAEELGLRTGNFIAISDGPADRVTVVDFSLRGPSFDRWLIGRMPPTGSIDGCWVEFSSQAAPAADALLSAYFPERAPSDFERVLPVDDLTRDPVAEFDRRPQRYAWPAAALGVALLFWLVAWFLRAEAGLYLAHGMGTREVVLMNHVQALVLIGSGAIAGLLWTGAAFAIAYGPEGLVGLSIAARSVTSTALLALIMAPAGAMFFSRSPIAALLKDR